MRGIRWVPLLLLVLLDPLCLLGQIPGKGKKEPLIDLSPTQGEIDGRSIKEWTQDLTSPDASVREEALRAMALFGKLASTPEIFRKILDRTVDPDPSPRFRSLQTIMALDIPDSLLPKTIYALQKRLREEAQVGIRVQAVMVLFNMGEKAVPAIPDLIRVAQILPSSGNSWEVRRAAVYTLAEIGRGKTNTDPPDSRCVSAMLTALKDQTFQVRMEGIRGFGKLGRPAESDLAAEVESELRRLTLDRDRVVSLWSWMSLMCVTDVNPVAVKAIRDHMQDKEARIRSASIRALAQLGSHARFAVPDLVKALKDPDFGVRMSAIIALAGIEDPGIVAMNGLQAIVDDKEATEGFQKLAKAAIEHIKGVKKMDKPDKK